MKKIIEKLASKELSFGCEIVAEYNGIKFRQTILAKTVAGNWLVRTGVGETKTTIKTKDIKKVIGHPVYIGDVLEKIQGLDAKKYYEISPSLNSN